MATDEHASASPAPQGGDPYREPENSTVDDWFGQDVERDQEDADRALAEAGGDADRAEQIFEEQRRPHEGDRFNVPAEERPANS